MDYVFVNMFNKLNERCQEDLEAIKKQYPFTPLKVIQIPSFFLYIITYLGSVWYDRIREGTDQQFISIGMKKKLFIISYGMEFTISEEI